MDGLTEQVYATPEEAEAAAKKDADAKEAKRKSDLVDLARKRFRLAEEAESEIRKQADEDIRFRAGEQWPEHILKERELDKRPALVINRMPQFERQVTNEQRQAKPAIKVSPVDSGADKETAEVIQGLIRHIENDSSAAVAYDTALTNAVRGGIGYVRAITEYESEDSFDLVLKILRVRDYASIYLDPAHQQPDASDANFAFVVDSGISEEQFGAEFPDVEPTKGGWGDRTDTKDGTCQVVEYFYRERVEDVLVVLQRLAVHPETGMVALDEQTGQPLTDGQPFKEYKSSIPEEDWPFYAVLKSRPTHRIKVCWVKIAGSTVVEEKEFPSQYIPIVPVLGDEIWVRGKRVLEGLIRHAKAPQQMYNFWATALTEGIALAPKAPVIAAEGQLEGYEKDWADAASKNKAYLLYRPKTLGGQLLPPPNRNGYEPPIAAMSQAMMFAADDMKATTAIYDASLGNRSNETSGRAIGARQEQSQVATFHFSDNLERGLTHLGRILVDAIPRVYSGARIIRILGEDATPKMVGVNGHPPLDNQRRGFDLGTGRYDVTVSMGPSYGTKRKEAVATQMEFIRIFPPAAQAIGDLVAENMDWPGAEKVTKRLKKMLPPQLQEPEDKEEADPAALSQQLAQQGQMLEQMKQELHTVSEVLEKKTLELQSQERKDLIARHTDLAKAFATAAPEDAEGRAVLFAEMQAIQQRLETYFAPAPQAPIQGGQ